MARASARRCVLVLACLAALTVPALAAGPASATQAEYDTAYRIGLEAYTYGLPLLATNATYLTQTSIDVSRKSFGPVNQFNSVRKLNDPHSKTVVAPGSNGLSSIAWLDLRQEPQVLHVPRVLRHFFVLGLIDPYTTNVLDLGSAESTRPGDYVICGPGQHDIPIPAGTHRIRVRYARIWIVGSTQLRGTWDVPNVNRIQDRYTLTPLSRFGADYQSKRPAYPRTKVVKHEVPAGLRFFDVLGRQLRLFPPPAADRAALRRFATVGVGPGKNPLRDRGLSGDTLRGLRAAVAAGPQQIKSDTAALFQADFEKYNGYLLGGFGRYGTDYRLRAVISQVGLGAFTSQQTIFALTVADRDGQPLSGSTDYVLHLPELPPAGEGWSLTVYDLHGFLIPNAKDRYQLSNKSRLTRNSDGSVDIYLQAQQPTNPAQVPNWIPTGSGQGFEVIWRLLAPKPDRIKGILDGNGWQPPAIMPAGAT
jgi:hypothetical protein